MRMPAVLLSGVALLAACTHSPSPTPTPAPSNELRYAGWVSDAMCGAEHVGGANASCVKKCLKGGADAGHPEWAAQAMVLVLDDSQKVLTVKNPEALSGREAKHVVVDVVAEEDGAIRVVRVVQ